MRNIQLQRIYYDKVVDPVALEADSQFRIVNHLTDRRTLRSDVWLVMRSVLFSTKEGLYGYFEPTKSKVS